MTMYICPALMRWKVSVTNELLASWFDIHAEYFVYTLTIGKQATQRCLNTCSLYLKAQQHHSANTQKPRIASQ